MSVRTLLVVLLVSTWNFAFAVTSAPVLTRACLDNNDSTVTITYSSISDVCGSFVVHHIYGSETGTNYKLLSTETNFNVNTVKIKLPNANPTWSFYINTRFLCNGVDSVQSNTLFIDLDKPDLNPIDSVSIDITTQKLLIGWQKNIATDISGYRIYKNSGGSNSRIGDTSSTHFVVNNQAININSVITIAAFDSCNLFSEISSGHRAMSLSSALDTCTRTVNLNWTKYLGWSVDAQDLYVSTNGSSYVGQAIDKLSLGTPFPGLNFGDSVCFFIRARNTTGTAKSSSSNITCAKLYRPLLPKTTYLSEVTVENNTHLKIECYVDNQGVSDSVVLYRSTSGEVTIGSKKLVTGPNFYSWTDNSVSITKQPEIYFIRTFAPCLGGTSTSLPSSSILLKIVDESLTWNKYDNWDGGVNEYLVYAYDGSTWNILTSTQDLFYENIDTTLICFRIEAVENQNSFGFNKTSESNEVCAKREPRFFVPNTLNPLSHNSRFRVIGPSIDKSNSTMRIFNRWGEIIFTTNNVDEGWSVAAEEIFIPLGIYFYDVALLDLNGNKHRLSGSVRVIR